jgi:hypothetical protein
MTDLEEQKTPPTNNIELPKVGIVGAGISGLSSKQMHSKYNFLQFFNNYFPDRSCHCSEKSRS